MGWVVKTKDDMGMELIPSTNHFKTERQAWNHQEELSKLYPEYITWWVETTEETGYWCMSSFNPNK